MSGVVAVTLNVLGAAALMYVPGEVIVTVGGARSIDQVYVAGVASRLPAASTARTSKVWLPSASAAVVWRLVQALQLPPSIRHSNVAPPSGELKPKVGVASLSRAGGFEPMLVSGGVRSTVHVCVAGVPSVLPAVSVARTSKVWLPSASAAVVCGLVQALQLPPSTRHWKVDVSLALNVNVGVASFEGSAGPESSEVFGAVLSTRRLATRSLFVCPRVSVATARRSYRPSATAAVFQPAA